MNSDKSTELVTACVGGDRKAQNTLYMKLKPILANVCRPLCRTKEDAEDVVAESMAKVFMNLGSYHGTSMAELAALDKVAKKSGMDCWFCTTTEGNFRDLENKGRAMSGKKAVKQLIEGLQSETFAELSDEEKFALLNAASKVM